MLFNTKNLSLAGLLLLSSSVTYAAPVTASFSGVTDVSNLNQFIVTASGITVNVSGWSDTLNHTNSNGVIKDVKIERAKDLDKFNGGWAMENEDEPNNTCGTNGHSADNFGNQSTAACRTETDYDFFMLAFSEEVSLTQATYGWINNTVGQNQVSVVALDTTNGLNNTLQNRSWNGIKNNHTLSSDSAQMQNNNNGYFTNFASTNVGGEFSTHWLIGALNSVFGTNAGDTNNNDGMKLAGVSFNTKPDTPPQVVPEPSSILLFGLAIMGFAASNRRKLK